MQLLEISRDSGHGCGTQRIFFYSYTSLAVLPKNEHLVPTNLVPVISTTQSNMVVSDLANCAT